MVRLALRIKATLENIEELKTCHPNYPFCFKITCTNCGEFPDKWHPITESERTQQDTRNPNGFNFYMKCKLCGREGTINIAEKSNASYTMEDSGKMKAIAEFDCRGAEPVAFSPRSGWIVQSADGGQKFEDVDLSDDDWVEYDENNGVSVGVYDFQSEFVQLKQTKFRI